LDGCASSRGGRRKKKREKEMEEEIEAQFNSSIIVDNM
jgi:hypothetical protein